MLSLDESCAHLEQKASRFGLTDARPAFFDDELLRMVWEPAVEIEPDVVATHLRAAIEGRGVRRVVLDAFANLESVLDPVRLNNYILSLFNYSRGHGITMLILKDSVVNRLQRVVSVVKTRDSAFDPSVRRYDIGDTGLRIGEPLRNVKGTLMGTGRLQSIQALTPMASRD